MKRVVITGMGIYSCLGVSLEEVKQSLYKGKSGIGLDPTRRELGFRSCLTGMVPKPDLKGLLKRRQRVGMAEQCGYAFLATKDALEQAGMDEDFLDQHEVGLLYGNDSSALAVVEGVDKMREKRDTTLLGSGGIFQQMNSTVTMNLATIFKVKGINFTISGACASGSHAIGMGYFLIKNGLQEQIICGGAQEINGYSMGSFDGLSAFSIREDEPTRASRPFDKGRDGLIPSGGAATVILESLESARRRGARILGEVIGYGFSSNGAHISQPSVEGPARSLAMSLQDAGLQAKDIDYINAHATSTPIGDSSEARAIDEVFGDSKPPVSSTKSMTGHECWMAGASEVIYSLLMMQEGFVAPNLNFEEPDEYSAKLNIVAHTLETNIDTFLSNSFGFGGTNSSLIIRKFKN
ncbi:MAG: beta-ketoacyl-[acyl-carrier-protein] synthase family protein [Bacteroidetes bacterium]|nr:MAG: beta-ketoacyl-[acyl-carrier-protein] synthase family protein [Bacteroidota bacterium]